MKDGKIIKLIRIEGSRSREKEPIQYMLALIEPEKGRGRFGKVDKFISVIIFDDQPSGLSGMADQLHTAGRRHQLSPFRHLRGRNVDDIAVFVSGGKGKPKIGKDSSSLGEAFRGKGYRLSGF